MRVRGRGEEEAEKDVKQVPKAAARPADRTERSAAGGGPVAARDKPAEHPTPKPAHDPTIPIVVGAGAASATVAAVAWRRAAQKAALQAAQAEFRRRAEEAAAKRVARATAGKAAGKAVATSSRGRGRADHLLSRPCRGQGRPRRVADLHAVQGDDRQRHPPSPEMKALIEATRYSRNSPSTRPSRRRQRTERRGHQARAAARTRQPGEFIPTSRDAGGVCQTSSIAGKPPQTVEDLEHAIEAARQHNAGKGGTGGTGGQGGAALRAERPPEAPPQPQAPPTPGAPSPHAPPQPRRHPPQPARRRAAGPLPGQVASGSHRRGA